METKVYNQAGKAVGVYDLPDRIFSVDVNSDVIHRALTAHMANCRQPLAHTKTRSEVRGGGAKPWKQKGTGRARHGSIRSPIWIGGGVTFGPRNDKNFKLKINKKEKQKALFMALSSKVRDSEIVIVDSLEFIEPKTKSMKEVLENIFSSAFQSDRVKKTLVVVSKNNSNVTLSTRNIPIAMVTQADSLNIYDVLTYKYLIIPKDAISVIDQTYKKINDKK